MYSNVYKNNIYKFNQVIIQNDEKLLIDNDEKIRKRIAFLEEQMIIKLKEEDKEEFQEGFQEGLTGLGAQQPEVLTAEDGTDGEAEESSVIKAAGHKQEQEDTLAVVSSQAQEMLASARKEAESIKSQSLMEARNEIEELRSSAMEEGRSQGYDEGYNQALEKIEEQKARLAEDRRRMEEEYQQLVDELEPKFIETLTDIYEKVFHVDLKKQHDIIVHLISSTMHKIEGNSNYLIHVSKEDYAYVNLKRNEVIASAVSINAAVEIVEDMTLGPNDCIIETDTGVFDCGLGTQLEELAQKLRLLSYTKK